MSTTIAAVMNTTMSNPFFKFKQFVVRHEQCAMKVGTDGVLLGAWTTTEPRFNNTDSILRILDIGTGSGLIALMLAQHFSEAHIDAIDIDRKAAEQAKENFDASPWGERLHIADCKLQEWKPEYRYDLIVSNPPFFQNSLKNPDIGRKQARHTDMLSFDELVRHSERLINENGWLALILPADAETEVRNLAKDAGFIPTHITHVFSKEGKPQRRVLLLWETSKSRNTEKTTQEDSLILEDDKGGRSIQYSELTKDFYL